LYYILDPHTGLPLKTDRGAPRAYAASKPTGAATKAFRVFLRSEAGKTALARFFSTHSRDGAATFPSVMVPDDVSAALEAGVARGALTLQEATDYRTVYPSTDSPIFFFDVDICVGRASAPGAAARRYRVRYVPLLKPNIHEIRKRINKLAHAAPIRDARAAAEQPAIINIAAHASALDEPPHSLCSDDLDAEDEDADNEDADADADADTQVTEGDKRKEVGAGGAGESKTDTGRGKKRLRETSAFERTEMPRFKTFE